MASIFGETAPPPNSVIVSNYDPTPKPSAPSPPSDATGSYSINSLKEELSNKLDSVKPRIQSVSEQFPKALTARAKLVQPDIASINSRIQEVQELFNPIHTSSISLNRRCQNLTLSTQSISSLEAPKKFRGIQNDFQSIQNEFDSSLQSIAILAKSLNGKILRHSHLFETIKNYPKDIQDSISTVNSLSTKISGQEEQISNLAQELTKKSDSSFLSLSETLEKQINEAEALIEKMTAQSNEGFNAAQTKGKELQSQKFDLKTSFSSITEEIQRELNQRIQFLKNDLQKSDQKTLHIIEDLQNGITSELDQIADETAAARHYTLLDEVEQEKEIAELDEILERISQLEKEIQEFPKVDNEGNPESFKGEFDGKQSIFLCYPDATFSVESSEPNPTTFSVQSSEPNPITFSVQSNDPKQTPL